MQLTDSNLELRMQERTTQELSDQLKAEVAVCPQANLHNTHTLATNIQTHELHQSYDRDSHNLRHQLHETNTRYDELATELRKCREDLAMLTVPRDMATAAIQTEPVFVSVIPSAHDTGASTQLDRDLSGSFSAQARFDAS